MMFYTAIKQPPIIVASLLTLLTLLMQFIEETNSRTQVMKLEENVANFGLKYFGMADERQGIVHIIGPEQGFTLPGTTCVCGDSHTATHGAFGALAFGIGTSEVEVRGQGECRAGGAKRQLLFSSPH